MGIETNEFAVKFTGELDKILCQKTAVGFMADNTLRAKFVGAKSIKIPQIDMYGLGKYDRDKGFIKGILNVTNSVFEMQQDRARTFLIDREDMDETGVAELAGSIMSEFVRTKVVPETDAYVISKLAGLALSRSQTISGADLTKPFECFSKLLSEVQSAAGFDEEIVCFVNPKVWAAFRMSNEFSKYITLGDFEQGKIKTQVHYIDNVPIIPVSETRMQTAFKFMSGDSEEYVGGFTPASGAKGIYMLMLPKKAASLVKKSEKIRTFTPEQNLTADAYKFDYRLYYDVFVKASYLSSVWVLTAPSINITSDLDTSVVDEKGKISKKLKVTATTDEASTIKYQWYSCDNALKTNVKKISGATTSTMSLDTALDAGRYFYFVRMSVDDATYVDSKVCTVYISA